MQLSMHQVYLLIKLQKQICMLIQGLCLVSILLLWQPIWPLCGLLQHAECMLSCLRSAIVQMQLSQG